MIKEAINTILDLASPETLVFSGRPYTSKTLHPVLPLQPQPLKTSTLAGLVDWIRAQEKDPAELIVQICGPNVVDVLSRLDDTWRRRENYVSAVAKSCAFPFGQQHEIEQFIINVQLNFEDSEDKTNLLAHVSKVSQILAEVASDDGISQSTVVKNEIGRNERVVLAPIQRLRPFRTFRDIEQPEGEFLLRFSKGQSLPTVALHAASGIAWEYTAIESIREYLEREIANDKIVILR